MNRIGANMLTREVQAGGQLIKVHNLGSLLPLFNHACVPNLDIIPVKGGIQVRPNRPIRKGEHLCVSYIDASTPRTNLRQWFDDCRCCTCKK